MMMFSMRFVVLGVGDVILGECGGKGERLTCLGRSLPLHLGNARERDYFEEALLVTGGSSLRRRLNRS